jgi:hypothetical protein
MSDRIRNRGLRNVNVLGRAQDAAGFTGSYEISELFKGKLHRAG